MSVRRDPENNQIPVVALHERAMDNLAFIRDTMARSAPLTAVSGWGVVAMGVVATVGSFVATLGLMADWWLYTWLGVAIVGSLTGFATMARKARRANAPVFSQVMKKFGLNLLPPILAGVILTEVLYEEFRPDLMPGTWLLLYGVGIVTAGAFSIRLLPIMGFSFIALGAAALCPPRNMLAEAFWVYTVGDAFLLIGFGVMHILFGLLIALRYNG